MGDGNASSRQGLLWEIGRKRIFFLKAALMLAIFWLIQFSYQFWFVSAGGLEDSAIRASSLGGALLITISLLIGPMQVLSPRHNYIDLRRAFGVAGFALIMVHAFSVIAFRFGGNVQKAYANLDPIGSAIALGIIAYWLLFPLLLTSTDWAMRKLRFHNWKLLHRTVYFTWMMAVFHFLIIRPDQLANFAGLLLLAGTALVFILQTAAFAKKIWGSRSGIALFTAAMVFLFLLSWLALLYPKYLRVLGIG